MDRCSGNPQVLAVVAVGSAVRAGVGSADIDLIAIVMGGDNLANERVPLEVDLRSYPANNLEAMIRGGHDYLGWAVKYGVPLYDNGHFWRKVVSKLDHDAALPSAKTARERAAQAEQHLCFLLHLGDEDAAREQLISFLTHLARAQLIEAGVYPTSRPELPAQLSEISRTNVAKLLTDALEGKRSSREILSELHPKLAS